MSTRMKRFDQAAEFVAALSIVVGGAFLIGWSSLL